MVFLQYSKQLELRNKQYTDTYNINIVNPFPLLFNDNNTIFISDLMDYDSFYSLKHTLYAC